MGNHIMKYSYFLLAVITYLVYYKLYPVYVIKQ